MGSCRDSCPSFCLWGFLVFCFGLFFGLVWDGWSGFLGVGICCLGGMGMRSMLCCTVFVYSGFEYGVYKVAVVWLFL